MAAHILTPKDPFRIKTDTRIKQLERFIQIMHHACKHVARIEKRNLEEKLSCVIKEDGPNALTHQMFLVEEFVRTHYVTMPQEMGYAFVILVYNLFEDLAQNLYVELKARENIHGPAKLQSHDFLVHLENFAKKVGISFDKWDALRNFKRIRNIVVHCGGRLSDKEESKLRENPNNNGSGLRTHAGQIQVTAEYAVNNLNLVREFFLEALQQKKFEDGHLFSTYSETPFALLVDKDKVTIKIVESASVDEPKLPIWDPIKVIAVGGESDFDTLKDELALLDEIANDDVLGPAYSKWISGNSNIDLDALLIQAWANRQAVAETKEQSD